MDYFKKYGFILILITAFLFFGTYYALAAPSINNINGVVAKGEKIVINGSSFGQHSNYNSSAEILVRVWENLENGKVQSYNQLADQAPYATKGAELVVGKPCRSGSSYCGKGYAYESARNYTNIWGTSVTTSSAYKINHTYGGQKNVFISGWFMFPNGFEDGINYQKDSDQTKFMMMSPDRGPKTYYNVAASTQNITWIGLSTEEGTGKFNADSVNNLIGEGNWARFDIYVDISRPEGQKINKWWINGKLIRNSVYNESKCIAEPGSDWCLKDFKNFSWLGYQFKGSDEAQWPQYVDDMYLDFTQARVEISNNSKWDETKQIHKEIQIPTAWSNSSITVKVNQGAFQNGETAYLYVIDENGNVNSSGYPIKFDGTSNKQFYKFHDEFLRCVRIRQ